MYPITETGSSSWARGIISKYSSGMELEGYYNPAFPNESILIPHYLFKPYLFRLIPLVILVAGLFGLAVPVKYPQPPVRSRSGRCM